MFFLVPCLLRDCENDQLSSFLYRIGLSVRPQTQRERNVVRFSAAVSGESVA